MPLPQNINPIDRDTRDLLVRTAQMDWKPIPTDPERSFYKLLWTGSESGTWAILGRSFKGAVAPPHKHLGASHTYVISGKIQVRDQIINAGDYIYEANGMVHDETTFLEDTDYIFICQGPQLFFDENGFTGYFGWEQLREMNESQASAKKVTV